MLNLPRSTKINAKVDAPTDRNALPAMPGAFTPTRTRLCYFFLFLLVVTAVTSARLTFMSPQAFVEGDDASLCSGIARLCTKEEIGAYFAEPPYIPVTKTPQIFLAKLRQKTKVAKIYLYRYHTMPGMYLLGKMACSYGQDIAHSMSWICFMAGTLFPIFLALFLTRSFGPYPPYVFPLCYAFIALSPEVWVSGSAYINDKIVASCLLAGCLYLTASLANRSGRRYWLGIILAGITFGGAILMRSDTVIFAPAIFLIMFIDQSTRPPHLLGALAKSGGLFAMVSCLTVLAVSQYMDSSLLIALFEMIRVGVPKPINILLKLPVFLSSYGWAQLVTFSVVVLALTRTAFRPENRTKFYWRPGRWQAVLLVFLLIFPEVYSALNFPVASQKYLLISSAVVAGLCCLLPFRIRQNQQEKSRLSLLIVAVPMLLITAGAFVPLGKTDVGVDGERYIGGQLTFTMRAHPDSDQARNLVALLENQPEPFQGNIVVTNSTWLFRETIAYESVRRRWQNSVVFTTETIPVNRDFRHFFDHIAKFFDFPEFYQDLVFMSFNTYSPPNSTNTAIWIPSSLMGEVFTPDMFNKTVPPPVYFRQQGSLSQGFIFDKHPQ